MIIKKIINSNNFEVFLLLNSKKLFIDKFNLVKI